MDDGGSTFNDLRSGLTQGGFPQEVRGASGGALDLSQPVFRPGNQTRVAEFLRALTFVKGSSVQVDVGDGAGVATVLKVTQVNAALSAAASNIYTDLTAALSQATKAQNNPLTTRLVRLGQRVEVPKIDASVAPASSKNAGLWRVQAALGELVTELDTALGQGLTGGNDFKGLELLSPSTPWAPPGDLEGAVAALHARVLSTGGGSGDGAHCLLGNDRMLQALMLTPTGKSNGSCGVRMDARTGRPVYHYLGLPFYRVNLTTTIGNTASIYAANLGPSGLQLVHAYGSAATLGFQVDEEPTQASTASRQFVVHGAWALCLWEPTALKGYSGFAVPVPQ
ncbi:MAG: hypothetical protein HY909_25485 [Deltaproteobacteria bacterium]|nr:hypothetical protein [Deltaproteobacteria bacterium]